MQYMAPGDVPQTNDQRDVTSPDHEFMLRLQKSTLVSIFVDVLVLRHYSLFLFWRAIERF